MVMVIINPGTESRDGATLANAEQVAAQVSKDLNLKDGLWTHVPTKDRNGWYAFVLISGGRTVEVDIPGDDPAQVCEGRPLVSRRLYVDGSSWLYGYALSRISERLGLPS